MQYQTAGARNAHLRNAFMDFVADDIKRRPEAIMPMPDEAVARMHELTEGIEVDLDDME